MDDRDWLILVWWIPHARYFITTNRYFNNIGIKMWIVDAKHLHIVDVFWIKYERGLVLFEFWLDFSTPSHYLLIGAWFAFESHIVENLRSRLCQIYLYFAILCMDMKMIFHNSWSVLCIHITFSWVEILHIINRH